AVRGSRFAVRGSGFADGIRVQRFGGVYRSYRSYRSYRACRVHHELPGFSGFSELAKLAKFPRFQHHSSSKELHEVS
ncbi:hypothetical protein, partial [Paenibacillus sp. FSL H8-237]